MAHSEQNLVCVGAIAGAFGVRGEARVKSFCADPAAFAGYGPLLAEDGRRFELCITREVKGGFAVRIKGIDSREAAEALRGTRLYAARESLPPVGDEEFYHADLIGLEVIDTGGTVLGRVRAIHDFGAGDVIEITGEATGEVTATRDLMLPFTRAAVPAVDIAAGRLVVDLDMAPDTAADTPSDDG